MEKALDHVFSVGNRRIARFVVNGLRENCYVVSKEADAFVIDCGARTAVEQQRILDYVETHSLRITHHLLTHAHFDHLWGAQWLFDKYGVVPTIPEKEINNYLSAQQMACQVYHREIHLPLPAPKTLPFVSNAEPSTLSPLSYIATAGHTMGGVCYWDEPLGILFSGDSLFKGYVGLPKEEGIPQDLMQKTLEEKIYILPKGTFVLPGHGQEFYL